MAVRTTRRAGASGMTGRGALRRMRDVAIVIAGCACFAFGLILTLRAHAGLSPWDVLHQGLARRLGLDFGTVNIIVSLAVLGLAWKLGARPGVGTVLNALQVGGCVNLYNALGLVPDLAGASWPARLLLDGAGILLVGIGTGFYIKGGLGAGPRDSLMVTLARRFGGRVAPVRAAIELTALLIGMLLGGAAGIGTLLFALGIGPAVTLSFRLFRLRVAHEWSES